MDSSDNSQLPEVFSGFYFALTMEIKAIKRILSVILMLIFFKMAFFSVIVRPSSLLYKISLSRIHTNVSLKMKCIEKINCQINHFSNEIFARNFIILRLSSLQYGIPISRPPSCCPVSQRSLHIILEGPPRCDRARSLPQHQQQQKVNNKRRVHRIRSDRTDDEGAKHSLLYQSCVPGTLLTSYRNVSHGGGKKRTHHHTRHNF